jgi:GT2 family glycosyltransferase
VIVPSFNGAGRLPALLESLEAQTVDCEVVVVDNGSTDGTRDVLAGFPRVRTLELPANAGFGPAVNQGAAATDAGVLVVVNDDAVYEPPFVERLAAALDPDEGVVMAAGVLLDAADPGTIDTAGVVVDRTLFALDHLHGRPASVLTGRVADPLGPTGGAAAYDRVAFDAVGGFDERFFAYLEDVDLSVRLLARGGRCRLVPDARGLHHHSATLGTRSRRKNALMGWGRGYTLAKYRLHRRPALFARALLSELVVASGQVVVDRTAAGVSARISGFRAGLRTPAEPLPVLPEAARRISVAEGLRYRLSRRRPRSGR